MSRAIVRLATGIGGCAVACLACSSQASSGPEPFEIPIVLPHRADAAAPDAAASFPDGAVSLPDAAVIASSPCPAKIGASSVTIDGVEMSIDGQTLWAPNPTDAASYDLFIRFHGPGAPSGTDVALHARRSGAGCDPYVNFITYRPAGDTQYFPDQTATCGFSVCTLPGVVGGRFGGTFDGTLTGSSGKTRRVKIVFDAVRAS